MKYAILGPKGTFSDLAFAKYAKIDDQPIYLPTIEGVIQELPHADYAIVPIENALDGYVQQTLDSILKHHAWIVDEIYIPVQYALVGNVTDIHSIERLYVQFVTKGQCQNIIEQLKNSKIILTDSNISSYIEVEKRNKGDAAIIPIHMNYQDFDFFKSNISDIADNVTRFVVLSKTIKEITQKEGFKVSLVITPKLDRPGLLFDILKIFKENQISLTSIMSRPTKSVFGTYNFFIDFKSNTLTMEKVSLILEQMSKDFEIHVLGIYNLGIKSNNTK